MKFIVSIHGYDCLDNVVCTARVREYQDYEQDQGELVFTQATVLRGEGIDNPVEWLRDVLVGLLELL